MPTELVTAKRRALLQELASRRVRLTAQRRLLLGIIQEADRHLDAAALLAAARLQDPRVNRATVYRTLALLKKLALVDELDLMHLEGEKHYYEAKRQSEHMHLACFRCGRIIEYSSPAFERLKAEIANEKKFTISVTRLEIGGFCAECRAAREEELAVGGARAPASGSV
jgi:Fur family transcriptional regulator, ferric uptake regulator